MNIKFIPMNIGGKEQAASAISRLEAVLTVYGCGEYAVCTESSMLVSELSAAFSTAEMVIVGVEPNRYCKTKQALMHAMHVKMQLNAVVSERISASESASGEVLAEQCSLPVDAEIFLTADGLYCGFAIKSGKQHFVMLPLLNGQLDSLIANGLLPYFDKVGIKPHEKDEEEPPVVNTVEDIDVPDEDEDEDETISEALLDWVRKSNNALQGSGLKTYFAKTPSSEMLIDLCDLDENSPFIFTDYYVERGSTAPKDYIADLARDSIVDTDSGIGAAVSNVFTSSVNATGEKKYNIYIAVADALSARVLRLVSEPGETPEQLVYAAAEKLFEMLFDKCVMGITSSQEIGYLPTQEEVERLNAADKKKKRKRAVRILIYCLLAIIITIFIYFTVDGVRAAHYEKNAAEATFATYAAAIETYGADTAFNSANGQFEIIVDEDDWFSTPSDEGEEVLDEVTTSVDSTEAGTITAEVKTTTVKAATKTTTTEIISSLKSTSTNATTKTTKAPATTKKPSSASTAKKTTAATTTKNTTATTTKHNSILDYFSTIATTAITSIVPTSTAVSTPSSGSFVITTYGYGHGVGMSQEGARGYAKQGWSHTQILNHYYPGTSVVKDAEANIPEAVTFGSKSYSLCEYLCCTVVAEIGYGASDTLAALEAQAVAAYTYAKRSGFSVSSANHAFKAGWAYGGSLVETAVKAVIGEYVSYNGSPANTFYFAMSAGKTTDVSTVWSGGSNYPYLKGGVASEPDKSCSKYKVVTTFSAEEMKTLMKDNLGVELTGDPAKWFAIVSHDSAVNSKIGYVTKMTVGGKSLKGSTFRNTGMQLKIRSHCFTIEYVK